MSQMKSHSSMSLPHDDVYPHMLSPISNGFNQRDFFLSVLKNCAMVDILTATELTYQHQS